MAEELKKGKSGDGNGSGKSVHDTEQSIALQEDLPT